MNLEALNKLSTEGLIKLKDGIDTVLASRLDTAPKVGRLADFECSKSGATVTVVINRINGKSVSCTETGTSVKPGRKWRVDPGFLKVRPVEKRASEPPRFAPAPKPHVPTGAGDFW